MEIHPDPAHPLTGPFWAAAAEQRLALPFCARCTRYIWYPRERCPDCQGSLRWRDIDGAGSLDAFSVVHRPLLPAFADFCPYVCALVSLAAAPGVRLVSQVVDCPPHKLCCDMSLQVTFRTVYPGTDTAFVAPLFQPD